MPLRPLQLGEMLDAAFRLVRTQATQVVVLVLLTVGALSFVQQLVVPSALTDPFGPALEPQDAAALLTSDAFVLGFLGIFLVQLVVTPVVNGAVTAMALAADRGGDASWQAGLRYGVRNLWRLLGTALLSALVLTVVFVVAVVLVVLVVGVASALSGALAVLLGIVLGLGVLALGVALYALLYVAIPVVVVEDVGPATALRRSLLLLRPRLLRTVGIVVVTGLLVGIFGAIAGIAAVPFSFLGVTVARVATGVVTALSQAVVVPFGAFVALLLYVDARVREEGLDVLVLTAELDRR